VTPGLATETAGSIVVGDSVTEATSTITFEGNNGTTALASVESTASALALGVVSAGTGDELSARGLSRSSTSGGSSRSGSTAVVHNGGRSSRGGGGRSLATENPSSVVVRGRVSEAAATITFESDDSTSTLAGVEATASTSAFRVAGTGTSDELGAEGLARACSGSSRGSTTSVVDDWCSRGGRSLTPQDAGSVVVGDTVAEAASTITLESDDSTCALASVESTASRATVGIRVARAGNELGTRGLTRNEGCVGEGCSHSDECNENGNPASEHDE